MFAKNIKSSFSEHIACPLYFRSHELTSMNLVHRCKCIKYIKKNMLSNDSEAYFSIQSNTYVERNILTDRQNNLYGSFALKNICKTVLILVQKMKRWKQSTLTL